MSTFDAEAIVIGGGPAGSATAMLLADLGHNVVLLDKSRFPRHKACSEYVNAGGVQVLNDLDVLDDVHAAGAHVMNAMHVHAPGGAIYRADFANAEPGRYAVGLSRYRLDNLLLERAKSKGVDVREHAHVRRVARSDLGGMTVDVSFDAERATLRTRLVVGADGGNSVVARSLGLVMPVRWPSRTGLVGHFRGVRGLGSFGEMHVTNDGYAGLAPLEDGLCNVAFVSGRDSVARRDGAIDEYFLGSLSRIAQVQEKLESAQFVGELRGIGPMAKRARRAAGDGYLLVGDAAGFLDPFTGDGIYEALRAAQLAAPIASRALASGDVSAAALAAYRWERRRVFTTKRQVCWIVQGFIHHPQLMDYATPRLSGRHELGQLLSGVLGNFRPASTALSPLFLARLLRP